jgi:hypothetical protein
MSLLKRTIAVLAFAVLVVTAGQSAVPARAAAALDLQNRLVQAFNTVDDATVNSLLDDQFVITNNADCTTPCEGRAELGVLAALRLKLQVLSATESGDTVTSRIQATSNNFNLVAPGINRILADTRLVTRNGKAVLLDIQLDLSDQQSKDLADQFRQTRGPTVGVLGVQNQFIDALNRADLAGMRALVNPGFFVQGNIGCATPCDGDGFLQLFATIRLRISVLSVKVDGNTVVSRVSAESPRFDLSVPGLTRIQAQTTATIVNGKVSSLVIQLDASDPLSAALAADLKSAAPSVVTTAPSTAAPAAAPRPAATGPTSPPTGDGGLLASKYASRGQGHRDLYAGAALLLVTILVGVGLKVHRVRAR